MEGIICGIYFGKHYFHDILHISRLRGILILFPIILATFIFFMTKNIRNIISKKKFDWRDGKKLVFLVSWTLRHLFL